MSAEEWRPVPGYESLIEVSSVGRVRTVPRITKTKDGRLHTVRSRVRKLSSGAGYPMVNLRINNKMVGLSVHRCVALAFIPYFNQCVNHINGIKTDNRVENLEWVSFAENSRHAVETGLIPCRKGVNGSRARLTRDQVIEIKKLIRDGFRVCEISKILGHKKHTVSGIKNGHTWSSVNII